MVEMKETRVMPEKLEEVIKRLNCICPECGGDSAELITNLTSGAEGFICYKCGAGGVWELLEVSGQQKP